MPSELIPTQFKLTATDKTLLSQIATDMADDRGDTLPLAASEVVRRLIRAEAAKRQKKNLEKSRK